MASKGKKKPSLFGLSREPLREEDYSDLSRELIGGTDRSSALIGCAMVDGALLAALNSRFVTMPEEDFEAIFFKADAPLGTFSARIKIAYGVGIYGKKVRDILDAIRRVRNVFAHSVRPLQFSQTLIEPELKRLMQTNLDSIGFDKAGHTLNPLRELWIANCIDATRLLEGYAKRHFGKEIIVELGDWPDGEHAPSQHKS